MNKKITTALFGAALILAGSFGSVNAHELTKKDMDNAKTQEMTDKKNFEEKAKKAKGEKIKTSQSNKKFDFTKGYNSKIEAIFVALTNVDKINQGYEIAKGADGKFYIKLITEQTYRFFN